MRRKRTRDDEEDGGAWTYLPHEVVTEILSWLPVKSLLRFRCVCKAWRRTISDDPSFVAAHLQHQRTLQGRRPPSVLILPIILLDDGSGSSMGLYRWDPPRSTRATLLVDMMKQQMKVHDVLAHCDGLVLVPTQQQVLLFNPATRQAATLPPSSSSPPPRPPAYGLGRGPSGAYKVARFFYREVYVLATDSFALTTGVEVFTVGAHVRRWRETAAQPPYPVLPERTATFHQASSSLLWTIDHQALDDTIHQGFLRFSLEDETFAVTPPPPPPLFDSDSSSLSELRGELCVARLSRSSGGVRLELWMSKAAVRPEWEQRHVIHVADKPWMALPRPVALFHDGAGIFFHGYDGCWGVQGYDFKTREFNNIAKLQMLSYRHRHRPVRRRRPFSQFFLVPYHDSLIGIP